jgi:hypothetical protein
MEKYYLLYNNEDQDKLLAAASSEQQIKDESQFYTDGVWFEYDDDNGNLLNEKKYRKKVKFPNEPLKRERIREVKSSGWLS